MPNGNMLRNVAEAVGGTVIGGLILRVLGLASLEARITNLEKVSESRHNEVVSRLGAIESALMKRE